MYHILSAVKIDTRLFRVCKRFVRIGNYLLLLCKSFSHNHLYNSYWPWSYGYFQLLVPTRRNRLPMDLLIRLNEEKLRTDLCHYRKYILCFIANTKRQETIYDCKNSYHRRLVHQFCETQNLEHTTIIRGYKKITQACFYCRDKYNYKYSKERQRKSCTCDKPITSIVIKKRKETHSESNLFCLL